MNIFEILVIQPLFNFLMVLYNAIPGGDFGISIILFTIILRVALYPLVKKQLHQTKLMRKLQPELEQIKKQYKGNRQMQGLQMMELYKRYGVSPFRSIVILLIQLPIFIALYLVIQVFVKRGDNFALYTYDFLEKIPVIGNIVENPSKFNESFLGLVDLTKAPVGDHGVSILMIVIAVAAAIGQYFQSKQTLPQDPSKRRRLRDIMNDAANGKEADQSEINAAIMNKMIYVLPFMMLFIMLSLPSAIALYYATMTFVAVAQQAHILKQDEEELEDIADHPSKKKSGKKATAKARAKQASEANVTRVVAKPSYASSKKNKGGKK